MDYPMRQAPRFAPAAVGTPRRLLRRPRRRARGTGRRGVGTTDHEKPVDAKISDTQGNWVTVATFDPNGVCTVKTGPATGAECGVGRRH